ncbi:ImmA/IrrE family metallo-endopeptidase [Sporosarcina soli]|uniref:ImmA/IrrE family metallo-endopeptidase n=1 Tax=Sporosarcina soli TaxID=334736 RepID=A0ABW0TGJ0_9BACL
MSTFSPLAYYQVLRFHENTIQHLTRHVAQLIKKYRTSNSYKLAENLGIAVVFEPQGSVHGYYSRTHRTKVIHINERLPCKKQLSICAHELSHAILHPNENTAFLKSNTHFPTSRIEAEAYEFMIELLFNQVSQNAITVHEAIEHYGIPERLLNKNFNLKRTYDPI